MTTRFIGTASRVRAAPSLSSFRFFSTDNDGGLYNKVAFIGAGKMAQALMSPLIKTGIQPADKITVFDVSTGALSKVKKQFEGIGTAQTLPELVDDADLIICCVKPQNLTPKFFEQVTGNKDATLLSVIAGKPIQTYLDGGFNKVARSMPNTPGTLGNVQTCHLFVAAFVSRILSLSCLLFLTFLATIGRGMTVWSCTENVSTAEREKIKTILNSFGKSVR